MSSCYEDGGENKAKYEGDTTFGDEQSLDGQSFASSRQLPVGVWLSPPALWRLFTYPIWRKSNNHHLEVGEHTNNQLDNTPAARCHFLTPPSLSSGIFSHFLLSKLLLPYGARQSETRKMSTAGRPRRTRRQAAIVDSSDEDEISNTTKMQEEEEDYAPEAAPSPRRQTRSRKSIATSSEAPSTPRPRGRPKKSLSTASIEPSEIFDADQTSNTIIEDAPEKKTVARKPRRSVAPQPPKAETPDLDASLLTPKPSASPESSKVHSAPLADITASSVNEQSTIVDDTQATIKPIRAMDTILEKPMDIVLKSRTMTVPVVEDTGPKPRLVITYLILTNFKSYAGRQEVGPFHSSFSSVVGPNGSGKSNVIDSLLFVFGFRASKMRQGKLSALIHNSAQHPDLDYCEVAVHFKEVIDQVRPSPNTPENTC